MDAKCTIYTTARRFECSVAPLVVPIKATKMQDVSAHEKADSKIMRQRGRRRVSCQQVKPQARPDAFGDLPEQI